MNPIQKYLLLFRQLGFQRISQNGVYRLFSRCGIWKILTPIQSYSAPACSINEKINKPLLEKGSLETLLTDADKKKLLADAELILSNQAPIFGFIPTSLSFNLGTSNQHWSFYDKSQFNGKDIKYTWEPARFGWAITLARAYSLTMKDVYCEKFWTLFEEFSKENPPNSGPYWASGQEIAIRIIVFCAVYPTFSSSPQTTPARKNCFIRVLSSHAQRIPFTFLYAQSQDNNHLLVEAAGLFTAGIFLVNHPQSNKWVKTGWKWFHRAVQSQIQTDGAYTQHSTNYHRLMLQTAIWMVSLSEKYLEIFPEESTKKLKAAALWLADLVDPISGHAPNLGNNDGAYFLPFSNSNFYDFRPVIQAAYCAFWGFPFYSSAPNDEMAYWFGFVGKNEKAFNQKEGIHSNILKIGNSDTWAVLRAAHFDPRAAHADQLHVDIWSHGENICRDAGTYSYNSDPPWDNPLSTTAVHNTIQINDQDQMFHAGKFLWLRLAQARILLCKPAEVMAEHDGYISLGWTHRRTLQFENPSNFIITDKLIHSGNKNQKSLISIHWLLPDWPFQLEGASLFLDAPFGKVKFITNVLSPQNYQEAETIELTKAGERILGNKPSPAFMGWYSPAYGLKLPSLSFRITYPSHQDLTIQTKIFILQFLNKR